MIAKPDNARAPFPAWPGIAVTAAIAAGAAVVLFLFDPTRYPFYPQCLFHRFTGWNCPGCGSLRAMHLFLHGHALAAVRDNALLMLGTPLLLALALRRYLQWRAGLPVKFPGIGLKGGLMIVGVLVVFTVLRNIPCAPFIYLSPP